MWRCAWGMKSASIIVKSASRYEAATIELVRCCTIFGLLGWRVPLAFFRWGLLRSCVRFGQPVFCRTLCFVRRCSGLDVLDGGQGQAYPAQVYGATAFACVLHYCTAMGASSCAQTTPVCHRQLYVRGRRKAASGGQRVGGSVVLAAAMCTSSSAHVVSRGRYM